MITSKGRVTTRVTQSVSFSNVQKIDADVDPVLPEYHPDDDDFVEHVNRSGTQAIKTQSQRTYPFNLRYNYVAGRQHRTQTTDILQAKSGSGINQIRRRTPTSWTLLNTVTLNDTLHFTPSGFSPSSGKSRQQYKSLNLDGPR